jgi:hypothetical protein
MPNLLNAGSLPVCRETPGQDVPDAADTDTLSPSHPADALALRVACECCWDGVRELPWETADAAAAAVADWETRRVSSVLAEQSAQKACRSIAGIPLV